MAPAATPPSPTAFDFSSNPKWPNHPRRQQRYSRLGHHSPISYERTRPAHEVSASTTTPNRGKPSVPTKTGQLDVGLVVRKGPDPKRTTNPTQTRFESRNSGNHLESRDSGNHLGPRNSGNHLGPRNSGNHLGPRDSGNRLGSGDSGSRPAASTRPAALRHVKRPDPATTPRQMHICMMVLRMPRVNEPTTTQPTKRHRLRDQDDAAGLAGRRQRDRLVDLIQREHVRD